MYLDNEVNDISEELFSEIYMYIKIYSPIYIEALFEKFKEELLPRTINRFELHGKLRRKYKDLYFSKDTVGFSINPVVSIDEIINKYIESTNGIINLDTIEQDLPHLEGSHLAQYLYIDDNYLPMFNRRYIHQSYIVINQDEIETLKFEMGKIIEKQNTLNGQIIMSLMNKFTPNVRNKVTTNIFSYHIARVFLNDNYYFDYPNIF